MSDRQHLADKLDMKHWDGEVLADAALRRILELEAMLRELVTAFNPEPNTKAPLTIWDRAAATLQNGSGDR